MTKPAAASHPPQGTQPGGPAFQLQPESDALSLRAPHHPDYGAIRVEWDSADIERRIRAGRRQPLARALGLLKARSPHIVDATAGLGRDAWVLAALGAHVTLLERSPEIAALLGDALRRALARERNRDTARRMKLYAIDSLDWLDSIPLPACDAIYLDPMYPEDGKTALPVKEMQVLRELTGGDADAHRLLDLARSRAPRVAVKRPRRAPPLAGRRPDAAVHATRVRFDLYFNPELMPCAG